MLPAAGARRRLVAVLAVAVAGVALGASGSAQARTQSGGPRGSGAGVVATPGFTSVTPARLLDTRTGPTPHPMGPAAVLSVKVTGVAGIPVSGVGAVALNVTAVANTHSTFITVYPTGAARPTASNLNVGLRRTRANEVIARVGTGGAVTLYNASGSTDVLVDVSGWFATGSSYTGQTPVRVLDTRSNGGAPRPPASALTVQLTGKAGVPTTGVSAVVLNLTGIATTRGAFITAYPTGTTRPGTSNLNLVAGQTAAMLVVAKPSAAGQITLYNSGGPTHLIVDVAGWFVGTADYTPLTPTRILDSRITGGFTSGADWPLQVGGQGGVPTTAGAVVITVTVVNPDKQGHLTVHPGGTPEPLTSNLNVHGGETTANLAVAQLAQDGTIAIANRSHDHGLLVDVVGWLAGNQQLVLVPPLDAPTALVGEPYALTMGAQAGRKPYTWTIAAGTLPDGLALSAAGKVSGTPTAPGTDFASFRVTDAAGQSLTTGQVTLRVYPQGDIWVWGQDVPGNGSIPSGGTGGPVELPAVLASTALATGPAIGASSCEQTYALQPDGTVLAWGGGAHGALGDNAADNVLASAPVPVSGLTGVQAVAAADCGGFALKSDGTVWAWGNGKSLGIGDSTNTDSLVPVQITALSGITAIAGGYQAAYAVKSDGTLWAWGDPSFGQLGNGGVADDNLPVQVSGLTDVVAVAGGFHTAYAVTGSGAVWAWGEGDNGELGDGSTTMASDVPIAVTGLSDVTSVAAGMHDGYAVESDGSAWAWGVGDQGELGDGGMVSSTTPVQVSGLTSVSTVAAAKGTGFALTTSGDVYAWGDTLNHLLGSPGSNPAPTPGRVLLQPGIVGIFAHAAGAAAFAIGPS